MARKIHLSVASVPTITDLSYYLEHKCWPGGTGRNFKSYGHLVGPLSDEQRHVLCDPQTSGGLLVAVDPGAQSRVTGILCDHGLESFTSPIGALTPAGDGPLVTVASKTA